MANLPITTDTSQLAGLEKAFDGITRAVGGLSRIAPSLAKVLEEAANKADKLAKAQGNVQEESEQGSRILERQKNILKGMVDGYSKGESSILATARAAGVAKDVFQELEKVLIKQREISGKNPFDDTISATRKLKSEIQALDVQFDALTQGQKITRSEAEEYVRTLNRARMAAEQMAGDPADWASQASYIKFVNKVLDEQTAEYKQLSAEKKKFQERNEEIIRTQKTAEKVARGLSNAMRGIVSQGLETSFNNLNNITRGLTTAFTSLDAAGKKIDNTLETMRQQINLMGQGFTKESANGVIAFERQLAAAGKTKAEIGRLSAEYRGLQFEIQRVSAENRKASGAFLGLQTILRQAFPAVGAVGLIATLTQLGAAAVRAADNMVLFRSRLQFVLQAGTSFDEVFSKLTATANQNRQALTDVVTLFNRIAPSMNAAGRSTNEILTVVDSFSKTLLISGANTREASSAILQFSQAMAAGRLNGDEFRSITEAAPEFLRRFAQATGVAAESLKELSSDGKLTSQVIADALIVMSDSVKSAAGSITINMAQAFQILKNNLTVTIDEINQATGATEAMAKIILGASDIVKVLGSAITFVAEEYGSFISTTAQIAIALGTAVGVYKLLTSTVVINTAALVGNKIAAIATGGSLGIMTLAANGALLAFRALTAAMLLNPFVAVAAAVAGLTVAFVDLGFAQDDLTRKTEQLENLQRMIPETMEKIIDLEEKRDQALASGNMEKAAELEKKVTQARALLTAQTANQSNAQREFNQLQVELGISTAATTAEIDAALGRIGEWKANLTGASKSVGDLEKKNQDLQFELNNVGKSTVEVAEARRVLTIATAEQVEAEALLLLSSDKVTETQQEQAFELIRRAQLLRTNAELELKLAKAQAGGKTLTEKVKEFDKLSDTVKNLASKYKEYEGKISDVDKAERSLKSAYESGKISIQEYQKLTAELNQVRQDKKGLELEEQEIKALKNRVKLAEELTTSAIKEAQSGAQTAEERNKQLENEIAKLGLKSEAIAELEAQTLALNAAELRRRADALGGAQSGEEAEELLREAVALEKQITLVRQKAAKEASIKVAEDQKKEFEKIQDDIAKSVGDAIIAGGQKGKDILKNMFKAQIFRIFIEPVIRGGVNAILGSVGLGGSSVGANQQGGQSLTGMIKNASGAFSGGGFGASFANDAANFSGSIMDVGFALSESTNQTLNKIGDSLVNNSEILGKVSAGLAAVGTGLSVFDSLKDGRYGSAIGEGVGYYFGGAVGGAIGKTLGGFVDKVFGFGGKISATTLPASFGQNVVENLNKQYADITTSLGGTALSAVSFGAGGNTGRQGQNPNFTIGASIGNRGVFNSANTREGQADGLFLAGEIALNETNLADQSLRALFSVLKETDFADNIDAVIDSVDTFSDSFENLQVALSDAQLLKVINEEFPKLGGALATLAGQSIETVKTFVLLAGGFENLQGLQNAYIASIYTEEEKLALATENLQTAFNSLGISVPNTTADFKALVEAQNLTTVEGQATYLALLQLSGAFAEITKANEEATRVAREAAEETARLTQEKILEERINLEKELYDLITESSQRLQDQRDALDESNRAIFDQIQLVKAEQAERERQNQILQEKLGLENQLLQVQGNTTELRRLEREALDESNRSLYDQIKALEDAKVLRDELTQKIQTQEGVITEIENRILGLQQQATQNYLDAQQRVAQAQGRVNDLILETARSFLNLGKTLRDFVAQQRQSTSVGSFQDTVAKALAGDSVALANLPELAGQAIAGLESTARSSLEIEQRKAAILNQVSMAAAVAEALGSTAVEEDPMVVAQRELTAAQSDLTAALVAANALNAPLVQVQQNLVTEYTKALGELATANTTLEGLLASLNLVNGTTQQPQTTMVNTVNGQVAMPVTSAPVSPTINAPALEQQIAVLTARVDQLIVENRAGQQAIANNTGKSAKILERADDGDSINVRIVT